MAYSSGYWPESKDLKSAVGRLHSMFTDYLYDSEHQMNYGGLHVDTEKCEQLSKIYSQAVEICEKYLEKNLDIVRLLSELQKLNLLGQCACLKSYLTKELINQYFPS